MTCSAIQYAPFAVWARGEGFGDRPDIVLSAEDEFDHSVFELESLLRVQLSIDMDKGRKIEKTNLDLALVGGKHVYRVHGV